jgi:hypothetical protein
VVATRSPVPVCRPRTSLEALVPKRGPLARLLLGSAVACGGVVALAGGVALSGSGLVAVGVAGAVSAALAAGVAREAPEGGRSEALDAAWKAAAWTIGALLLISGLVVLAGGVVATLVTGLVLAALLAVWLVRAQQRGGQGAGAPGTPSLAPPFPASSSSAPGAAVRGGGWADRNRLPVSALPTEVLGREWLRTTAALAGRLEPSTRQTIVRRREETLDELERRDPGGFARWLAAGPASDPAQFVRRDVRGDQAAGTDAA